MIRPPSGERAKAVTARSISPGSRRSIGLTSTPTDGATYWMTANWPIPEAVAASRRTAARFTPGAISLSSSGHFAVKLYSNCIKPVALPPGRDRLLTRPAPTGSGTITNTIGTVRVACSNCAAATSPLARITSGARAANSAAYLRMLSALAAPQRDSIRTLRPSVQPNCCSTCRNAARRACTSGSPAAPPKSTPMRRIRSVCCARAASGHVAAAPATSVMNSRRLIAAPGLRRRHRIGSNECFDRG